MDSVRTLLVAVPLLGLLAAAIWFAAVEWVSVDVPAIPAWGYAALVSGVVLSLAVGIGLMALIFYSSRHGYDDAAAGRERHDRQP